MKNSFRSTPQTTEVLKIAQHLGHATNMEILKQVQLNFPDLTPTTVHRITSRLILNGKLQKGPEINGIQLVDGNISSHDHFICEECNIVKDVNISSHTRDAIKQEAKLKIIPGSLTIYGNCKKCPSGNLPE